MSKIPKPSLEHVFESTRQWERDLKENKALKKVRNTLHHDHVLDHKNYE
jgi:hypothetical protein